MSELYVCDKCGFEGSFRSPWACNHADFENGEYWIACQFCAGKGKMWAEQESAANE